MKNRQQKKQEPDQLYVTLVDWKGNYVELQNDGTMTTREVDDETVNMLQTRAAFRGFVGSLTGLMNYKVYNAYGVWVDEMGFSHTTEEEGGVG